MDVLDSPIESLIKRIDEGAREGFKKVKKEMQILQEKTEKLDSALKLQAQIRDLKKQCEGFVEESRFQHELGKLKLNDAAAQKAVSIVNDLEKLKLDLGKYKDPEEYEARLNEIWEILSTLEVKKIDIAKLENQIGTLKNQIETQAMNNKKLDNLNQDFVDFRKKSLTTYNFDRLEAQIKDVDKDVKNLIYLHEYIKELANKTQIKEMQKSFDKSAKSVNRLSAAVEDSQRLDKKIRRNSDETSKLYGVLKTTKKNNKII